MKDQMVRVAKEFAADESGVGVVGMILILVVLTHKSGEQYFRNH